MKNNALTSFLKISLDILIAFAAIVYFVIIGRYIIRPDLSSIRSIITYSLFIVGGGGLYVILFSLRKIVSTVTNSNPFVYENAKRIRNISIGCFIISAGYVLNFFINTQYKDFYIVYIDKKGIHTDLEFLIFFFAGWIILILSEVFRKAIEIKEENDYTI
ncbi:DUF2975 domain-containing protein [Clostridium thailandense]|uniref:DUF2975 domain-containing protein n=1 Tax=Clostridium thailandense TaxID=2794346 RepID=A0A949WTU7_9CLOT|nr:DUF2975 domain-containing protein [Clostridium thailandense]MBV7276606.1 DUF2975 domain-containing protein [Clostridium thailandense]